MNFWVRVWHAPGCRRRDRLLCPDGALCWLSTGGHEVRGLSHAGVPGAVGALGAVQKRGQGVDNLG